ncbi:MAG: transporter substrate-binding domain-containing protein [Desulfosarcinaceae bacterium]|jgi:polar amino acid transport system substrate-binding protein
MSKKYITAIFLLFLSYPAIVSAGKLSLVTLESPPAEYLENGQQKGINIDIVKEGLNRMGHECEIKFVPWKRALLMVKNGKADGIIDAAYNEERAEYLHYPSEEIYVEKWYCFKRKNSDLTLDIDFKNAGSITLGTSRGFVYGGKIQEMIDRRLFKRTEEVYNNELNIKKLIGRRIDMFVGVKATILFLAKKMGYGNKIDIVKQTGTTEEYLLSSSKTYLGFSKKTTAPQFAEQFSTIVAEMKADGTIEKISMKYF